MQIISKQLLNILDYDTENSFLILRCAITLHLEFQISLQLMIAPVEWAVWLPPGRHFIVDHSLSYHIIDFVCNDLDIPFAILYNSLEFTCRELNSGWQCGALNPQWVYWMNFFNVLWGIMSFSVIESYFLNWVIIPTTYNCYLPHNKNTSVSDLNQSFHSNNIKW